MTPSPPPQQEPTSSSRSSPASNPSHKEVNDSSSVSPPPSSTKWASPQVPNPGSAFLASDHSSSSSKETSLEKAERRYIEQALLERHGAEFAEMCERHAMEVEVAREALREKSGAIALMEAAKRKMGKGEKEEAKKDGLQSGGFITELIKVLRVVAAVSMMFSFGVFLVALVQGVRSKSNVATEK